MPVFPKHETYGKRLKAFKVFSDVNKWLAGGLSALWFFTYDKIACWEIRVPLTVITFFGIYCFATAYLYYTRAVDDLEYYLETLSERERERVYSGSPRPDIKYPGYGERCYMWGVGIIIFYALVFLIGSEWLCKKPDPTKCCCEKAPIADTLQPKPTIPDTIQAPIVLHNVHFDVDSANIRDDAKPDLNTVAAMMQHYPTRVIELSAHTDSTADDDHNMHLSRRRADAAKAYLTDQKKIAAERIVAVGYGEAYPRMPNSLPGALDSNRRVEFKILRE